MSVSARVAGAEMVGRVTEDGDVAGEFTVGVAMFVALIIGFEVGSH